MEYSLKGDVDLMYYNSQSEDDLKKIYDEIMNYKRRLSKHPAGAFTLIELLVVIAIIAL